MPIVGSLRLLVIFDLDWTHLLAKIAQKFGIEAHESRPSRFPR